MALRCTLRLKDWFVYNQSRLRLLGDIIEPVKYSYPPQQSNSLNVITLLLSSSINGFFTWRGYENFIIGRNVLKSL